VGSFDDGVAVGEDDIGASLIGYGVTGLSEGNSVGDSDVSVTVGA